MERLVGENYNNLKTCLQREGELRCQFFFQPWDEIREHIMQTERGRTLIINSSGATRATT